MSREDALEFLYSLNPSRADDYQQWLEIGMALHSSGAYCSDWDEWSRQSPKYKAGECEKKWRTFGKYSGSTIGLGTLGQMAKDDGYKFSQTLDWNSPIGDVSKISNISKTPKTPNEELSEYLKALFKSGESINFVANAFEKDGKWLPSGKGVCKEVDALVGDLGRYSDIGYVIGDTKPLAGAWIRLNPVSGEGCKNADIVEFRHALIESDSLPKEAQLSRIREMNLPCAAIVDSGGKSIHAIVKIDAGKDEKLYRERVAELHEYLEKQGFPVDKACKNPSRLSRMPGVVRAGVPQALISVNSGARSYKEWLDTREEAEFDAEEIFAFDMRNASPNDMSDALLGNRFFCRGDSWLMVAQSGIGKSVLAMQAALHLAVGRPILDIPTHAPYKVLLIQAENNRLDLVEPFQSISAHMKLSAAENALLDKNLVVVSENRASGELFVKFLSMLCKRHRPNIVIIDPLLSYIGDDISKQAVCSVFLRNWLNPVIKKFNVGALVMHHTGKPKDKQSGTLSDLSYLGIGSSELTNWARAVSVITQNSDDNDIYELRHVKRGKRTGTPLTMYLRHSTDGGIYWEFCPEPSRKIKTPRTYKSKYDSFGFENMPPLKHDKDLSKSAVLDFIRKKLAEHAEPASTKDAMRVFETLRKLQRPMLVFKESHWQGSLYLPSENEGEVSHA